MICNYTNINDLCTNKYSYSFNSVIPNGTSVIVDKSETAPVLRTDKVTGQTKVINQFSQNLIPTCDSSDDNENITEWECYLIYRYLSSGIISDPPLQTFKNAQIDSINNSYNASIEDGILVNINNQNVVLGSSLNDQIVYKSVLSYAQALYDDDTDAVMPSFSDKYGKIYSLSYDNLISVFTTYLEKVIYYKNLRDTLISKCDSSTSVDSIQGLNWCNTKPIEALSKNTVIVSQTDKPSIPAECIQDFIPSTSAPVLRAISAQAQPEFGFPEACGACTLFSLEWEPPVKGNGGLVLTENGLETNDDFTHYEVQRLDFVGEDGSGSVYGWGKIISNNITPPPYLPAYFTLSCGTTSSYTGGTFFTRDIKSIKALMSPAFFTPFNQGLLFRVRTVILGNPDPSEMYIPTIACGIWSNTLREYWKFI